MNTANNIYSAYKVGFVAKKLNITLKLIENKYKDTKNFRKTIKQNENMAKSEMPKTKKN